MGVGAASWIQSSAQDLPYAMGVAKNKKQKPEIFNILTSLGMEKSKLK